MELRDAMSKILDSACHDRSDGNMRWFTIETHCVEWKIEAELIAWANDSGLWQIDKMEATRV
jgi:hypothetical protein